MQGWLNTFYFDNYTIPDDEQQADEAGKERKKERKNKWRLKKKERKKKKKKRGAANKELTRGDTDSQVQVIERVDPEKQICVYKNIKRYSLVFFFFFFE